MHQQIHFVKSYNLYHLEIWNFKYSSTNLMVPSAMFSFWVNGIR
jgi:hypothetical protein